MPKSKRNKMVPLTKVKKKTKEWKEGLINSVREYVDRYPSIFLLQYENMRNDKFKELREELRETSKFCMGSTKVLRVALGHDKSDEYRKNLSLLSENVSGSVGLFFTSLPYDEVLRRFEDFAEADYARAGSIATEDVQLTAGPLHGPLGPLSHTQEPFLRQHGLPTRLNKGIVELISDFTVVRAGETITPNQAALLRVFEVKMAVFRMTPIGWYHGKEYKDIIPQTSSH